MVRPASPSITPSRRPRIVSMQRGDSFSTCSSVTSTNSYESAISSRSSRSGRRMRAETLVPGSLVHDAFFGNDDKIRESFDEETASVAVSCHKRNYIRQPSNN